MKSYIQGLITGAVFVFSIFVFIGATDNDTEVGRYAISSTMGAKMPVVWESIIDTKTGRIVERNNVNYSIFK